MTLLIEGNRRVEEGGRGKRGRSRCGGVGARAVDVNLVRRPRSGDVAVAAPVTGGRRSVVSRQARGEVVNWRGRAYLLSSVELPTWT
jgi:hypothetical protein